jgi:hypothetical protein
MSQYAKFSKVLNAPAIGDSNELFFYLNNNDELILITKDSATSTFRSTYTSQDIENYINNISVNPELLKDLPTGSIIESSFEYNFTNYLLCNGAKVSKTTYANLYSVIQDRYAKYISPNLGKPWQQQYYFNNSFFINNIAQPVASSNLPNTIARATSIVTKNYLYIMCGRSGTNNLNTTYYAPILPDGTIGGFTTDITTPVADYENSAILYNNTCYLLPGFNNNIVYRRNIDTASGTLTGSWINTGNMLSNNLAGYGVVLINNNIFIIGGYRSSGTVGYSNAIYKASINTDGTITPFTLYATLPISVAYFSLAVIKNFIYIIGGFNGSYLNTIYRCSFDNNANLSAFSLYPLTLNYSSAYSQAVVTKDYLILFRGTNGSAVVSNYNVYPINPDGSISNFVLNLSLLGVRAMGQAVTTNSAILYLGGSSTLSNSVNNVYIIPFNGGLNNYLTLGTTNSNPDSDYFYLPDLSSEFTKSRYYYIRT